jgi:hypothetical protein
MGVRSRSEVVRVREEFGAHLIGRDVGKRIRVQYFSGPQETWPRALDLTGVEQVTESCADELFGTLARRAGVGSVRSIELLVCTPAVREAIDYVLALVEKPPTTPNRAAVERLLGRPERRPVRSRK